MIAVLNDALLQAAGTVGDAEPLPPDLPDSPDRLTSRVMVFGPPCDCHTFSAPTSIVYLP
jgi:hypothetical protein